MKTKDFLPHIENAEMLSKKVKPLYILTDYMDDEPKYVAFKEQIYDLIKGGFEHKDVREFPIKFKFYRKEKKTYTLQLRHFVLELFILYPIVFIKDIDDILDETFIPDFENDIPYINDFINYKLIDTLRNNDVKNTIMNRSISSVLYDLKRISMDFSLIMGMNFSTEMFIDLYNNQPSVREIMESKFPENAQPVEIENIMNERLNNLIEEIKKVPDNNLSVVLRAKTGIKPKQLGEYMIAQAQKPDIEGKLITIPIENSTLIGGTNRPSYHYIDASAARKSLILNNKIMGKAGYYGKKVMLLSMTLSLSKTVHDCGTKHLIPYNIWGEKVLQKLNDRYYRLENDPSEELKLLNAKKDKHLIGKTIWVRSVVTCALGNEVCHCCVGKTAKLNLDIARGFGGFESEEITKVVNQNILSAKHLLSTDSEKIDFNDDFYKFFRFTVDEISPLIDDNPNIENPEDYGIYVNPASIKKADEFDLDTDYSTYIEDGKFEVVNFKTNERIPIYMKEDKELYITTEIMDMIKRKKGYVYFKDLEDSSKLFNLIINNNELTKPLYDIMDLTNKEKKAPGTETISGAAQAMLDLCIKSNISANAVAGECILNRLIREVDDDGNIGFERPDFSHAWTPKYKVWTLDKCLEHNRDPFIGLAAQELKRQILSDEFMTEKTEPGYLAPLFSKYVDYKANWREKDD